MDEDAFRQREEELKRKETELNEKLKLIEKETQNFLMLSMEKERLLQEKREELDLKHQELMELASKACEVTKVTKKDEGEEEDEDESKRIIQIQSLIIGQLLKKEPEIVKNAIADVVRDLDLSKEDIKKLIHR